MNTNMSTPFKVGAKVFVFDPNRRVYKKTPDGRSAGSPIYRGHFREVIITGETSRSWLVGEYRPTKYPKNGQGLLTAEQVEDECWKHDHKYKIIDLMRNATAKQLREIAALIGYKP